MNTTVESLKNLYVELGGELTDTYPGIADGEAVQNYTNIPDCLDAVNALVKSGATKELPAVGGEEDKAVLTVSPDGTGKYRWFQTPLDTVCDNMENMGYRFVPDADPSDAGKVPTVQSDGSYALAEAGGGGSGPFVVTFSGTTAAGNAACDKTVVEIINALQNGNVLLKYVDSGSGGTAYVLSLTSLSTNAGYERIGAEVHSYFPFLSNFGFIVEVNYSNDADEQKENALTITTVDNR